MRTRGRLLCRSYLGMPYRWNAIGTTFYQKAITKFNELTQFTSVTSIPTNAFRGCPQLVEISLPAGVTIVGSSAFNLASSLKTINLSSSLKTIGSYAFYLSGLAQIDLPSTTTTIESNAFQYCYYMKTIIVRATTPPTLGSNALYGVTPTAIYVPSASVAAYKSASGWSAFASKIEAIQE